MEASASSGRDYLPVFPRQGMAGKNRPDAFDERIGILDRAICKVRPEPVRLCRGHDPVARIALTSEAKEKQCVPW